MSTTPTSPSELYYDPYDYEIDANPHPIWHRLREEAPLYYNEKLDFYALSRFDDVWDASIDHETFSSAHGTVLEVISDNVNYGPMMIWLDPPDHTQLRKLVGRAFTPRRILTSPFRHCGSGGRGACVCVCARVCPFNVISL